MRAFRGKLGSLSAGRRAKVGHAQAAHIAQQQRGQSGGGILHPPCALRITFDVLDAALVGEPHRARRQKRAAEPGRPFGSAGLYRKVERRLTQMGGGDLAGNLFAVMLCPAPEKPVRRVELCRILLRNDCRCVRAYLAQDRVDEACQAMGAARGLRLLDGEADRGVRGNVHEGELSRGRDQDEPGLERLGGQRFA